VGSQIHSLRTLSASWLTAGKPAPLEMANIREKRPSLDVRTTIALAQNGAFPPEQVNFLILSVEAAPLVNGGSLRAPTP
jgi:hypothetical protein